MKIPIEEFNMFEWMFVSDIKENQQEYIFQPYVNRLPKILEKNPEFLAKLESLKQGWNINDAHTIPDDDPKISNYILQDFLEMQENK